MLNNDLIRALSAQPAPIDQAKIQERTLNILSRLSLQDPVQSAKKYQADSLKRLARLVENTSDKPVNRKA